MAQAAFVCMIEVADISLEALAVEAGNIQDAVEEAGYNVLYVHPYDRPSQVAPSLGGSAASPFAPPNPGMPMPEL